MSDGTGRYATALALRAQSLPFFSGRSLGELCHIVQLAVSRKIVDEPARSVTEEMHLKRQTAKGINMIPMTKQSDKDTQQSYWKTSLSQENAPGTLTISTLESIAHSKKQQPSVIPKPLKHMAQLASEACRRLSLENILDRTHFAEEALQSVKNTFIHFADPSVLSLGSVRRSHSIPKDFGSCKNNWETSCHALNSMLPENNSLGARGCDSPVAAKFDMTAINNSPTNSGPSSNYIGSANSSPVSTNFGCWVSSPVSTADNTPTNSDDDVARYGKQPLRAVDPFPVHGRSAPLGGQNQQSLMKLRATGQALMLELQSKTDFEGQHQSRRPLLLQSPTNSQARGHQFGVRSSPCHNEFGAHWMMQHVR